MYVTQQLLSAMNFFLVLVCLFVFGLGECVRLLFCGFGFFGFLFFFFFDYELLLLSPAWEFHFMMSHES